MCQRRPNWVSGVHQPSVHLAVYFALSSPHPELYTHTTFGPFASEKEFLDDFVYDKIRDPTTIIFAIIDKTRHPPTEGLDGALAGIVGYLNSVPADLSTEIGFIFILPSFQKTGVASTVVGLMLQHALEPEERGGLALRRVQWQTNSLNAASRRLAERMGFQMEGILRWQRIFPAGGRKRKMGNGRELPEGSDADDLGRDTAMLAICWDDWKLRERDRVLGLLGV